MVGKNCGKRYVDDRYFQCLIDTADHKADIRLFEAASAASADPDLKAWAIKTLPLCASTWLLLNNCRYHLRRASCPNRVDLGCYRRGGCKLIAASTPCFRVARQMHRATAWGASRGIRCPQSGIKFKVA